MTCPKCGSDKVSVTVVAEQKRRGCMNIVMQIFLAIITLGVWLIVLWIRGRKTVEKTLAVCQACGKKWRV